MGWTQLEPLLCVLLTFLMGLWVGWDSGRNKRNEAISEAEKERDRAVRLATECSAHMEQVQSRMLLLEVDVDVWVMGQAGEA